MSAMSAGQLLGMTPRASPDFVGQARSLQRNLKVPRVLCRTRGIELAGS
jgi:hypothetical protein